MNIADKEYCLGRGLAAIRARPNAFDARFLHYVLAAGYATFQARGVGSTFINISSEQLADFKIPKLPLDVQRSIASTLDKADDIWRNQQKALALLRELPKAVFIDMFGDPETNPKKLSLVRLGDVIHSASDGPHVSPKYASSGIPFISTRHVRHGEVLWEDLKYISRADAHLHWKKCKPERGDILYTKGGTTGIAAAIDFDQEIAVWVHVALLKPKSDLVLTQWLEAMLNSEFCYRQSQKLTRGIANHDLGLTRMVDIRVLLPTMETQKRFVERINEVKRLKTLRTEGLNKSANLFASLQHRAFRGEWSAKGAERELAIAS
jgi:type I restriction enzyme, S subunit